MLCWPYGLALRGNLLAVADSGNNRYGIFRRRTGGSLVTPAVHTPVDPDIEAAVDTAADPDIGIGDDLAADLAAASLVLARRFAAGVTLWCLAPSWEPHAQHVAVEFVHPVIVGKTALPAVALTGADLVSTVRVSAGRVTSC